MSESNWSKTRSKARENFDELVKAHADQRPDKVLSHIEKQERTVELSLDRCPRCGDHVVLLFPGGMGVLCKDCLDVVRSLDLVSRWFSDMVRDHNACARETRDDPAGSR